MAATTNESQGEAHIMVKVTDNTRGTHAFPNSNVFLPGAAGGFVLIGKGTYGAEGAVTIERVDGIFSASDILKCETTEAIGDVTIPSGTLVQINGYPFVLGADVSAIGGEVNLSAALAPPPFVVDEAALRGMGNPASAPGQVHGADEAGPVWF
jgi:hypothetical protein